MAIKFHYFPRTEKSLQRQIEHDKIHEHLIAPHRKEVGTLWKDGFDHIFLIADVVLYPYDRPDFVISRADTGEIYRNEVNDFYQYHVRIS